MGIFSKFEGKIEDTFENAAGRLAGASLSPVQIAKKAEKQMRREKMVGAGKQYAPTLYTVLVSPEDDDRLFGYYPTLAGETETYLAAKAAEFGFVMDGQPLVRFIPNEGLKRGKFEVIAEAVAAPIVSQLRREEIERYGMADYANDSGNYAYVDYDAGNYDSYGYVENSAYDHQPDYGYDVSPQENDSEFEPIIPNTMVFPATDTPPARNDRPNEPLQRAPLLALKDIATGKTFPLKRSSLLIGRETSNDIVLADINASREHAELSHEPNGEWLLIDLRSTNGTFVNGREIESSYIYEGDRITIGTTTLALVAL